MERSWIRVLAIAGLEVATIALALPVSAQIEADDTLGAERSRLTPDAILRRRPDRAGTRADLIEGGAQRAGNLFHSFERFNVNDGQSVYFDNPDGVNNIFGRVTGTEISNILGTLGVDGNANLFLLNPNGILFGPNARLDVNGSFVGSTANAIQFGDQGFFSTVDPSAPPLLTVNPSAFLFNQVNPNARIVSQSTTPLRFDNRGGIATGLEVPLGRSLLLLGGDVVLEGGGVNAFGGRVELGGLSSPGTVGLTATGDQFRLTFPENVAKADVTLRDGARVDVVADNGGDVAVNAGNVDLLNGSNIFAGIGIGLGFPGARAGDVEVNASGVVTLSDSSFVQSSIFSGALGDSGNVSITGQSVNLLNGSALGSAVVGQGKSGEVRVQAADTITIAGQNAQGTGSGILSLVGALEGFVGSGEGSDIDIQARSLVMADGAQIGTSNLNAIGDAGDVRINLTDSLLMRGDITTIQAATTGDGDGGNIFVTAGNTVDLRSGARFFTNTRGTGDAGDVTVTAGNSVVFDGVSTDYDGDGFTDRSGINSSVELGGSNSRQTGAITINTGRLTISNEAGILNNIEAGAVGSGQGITINADSMQMLNGAQVQSLLRRSEPDANGTSLAPAQGRAGDININLSGDFVANPFINGDPNNFGNRSEIFTSVGEGAVGDAGDIFLSGRNISLLNGSRIISDTFGAGNSGSVTIRATEQVLFDGTFPNPDGGDPFRSGVFSSINRNPNLAPDAQTQRIAGDVNVNAGLFVLRRGGSLYANVEQGAIGQGGNINITGGSMLIQDGSQIQSILRSEGEFAGARGRTGNITVTLTGSYRADGEENNRFSSGLLTSVETGTEGDAGNITVQARSIELTNGARFVTETQGQGNAGSVTIGATDFISFDGFGRERSGISSSVKPAVGDPVGRFAGAVSLTGGDFIISNGAAIFTNVEAGADGIGGTIVINANDMLMFNSAFIQSLLRNTEGETAGATGATGNVDINLSGDFVAQGINPLEPNNSNEITTSTGRGAQGNAGNIDVDARSIWLFDGARFVTETQGLGNAGRVTIGATDSILFDGVGLERSGISSSVKPAVGDPVGRVAGDVLVTGGDLILSNGAAIFTNVEAGADGTGGDIVINANNMLMFNSAFVQSLLRGAEGETAGATGATGNVDINLSGDFVARGINPLEPDSNEITTSAGVGTRGNAGNIEVNARSIRLFDGAGFVTQTAGQGNAGAVTITADGVILFDGVNPDDPGGRTPSGIASSVFAVPGFQGNRRAGNIRINDGIVRLNNGATIFANLETGAVGRGGDIIVDAQSLSLRDGSQLQAFLRGSEEANGGAQGRFGTTVIRIRLDRDLTARGVGDTGLSNALFTSAERNTVGDAGDIIVQARSIRLRDGSRFVTETRGQGNAGRVQVRADRSILFDGTNQDARSGIASSVFAAENATDFRRAGRIEISTGNFSLTNDATIFSNVETGAVGRSGDIFIDANSMSLTGGGQIQSILRGADFSNGLAGARGATGLVGIDLGQGNLTISGAGEFTSGLFTIVEPGTRGDAGDVAVRAGTINVENRGIITSSTEGAGDGGRLDLRADQSMSVLQGGDIKTESTGLSSGQAGSVELDTRSLTVAGTGSSVSATSETTSGGNIAINAEEVTIQDTIVGESQDGILASSQSGRGGRITFSPRLETLQIDNGSVSASTDTGEAGSLTIREADLVWLTNSAVLSVAANDDGGGAGDIDVDARTLRVDNGAEISASTVSRRDNLLTRALNNSNSNLGSGNITLRNLETLEVENGVISASTREGQAGTLIVDADGGTVELRDRGRLRVAASEERGDAGDLEITSDRFFAEDSAASVSSAAGQAGNLSVDARAIQLDNGRLTARTAETGADINLQNVEQLYMRNGSQISAPASQFATGGNVTLDNADGFTVAVPEEDSDIIAAATEGQGGNINIDTLGIYNFRVGTDQPITNDIDASSQFNRQGSVNINTPDTDPSRGLIELPSGVVDASQQIDRTCRARGDDDFGEFVVTGRGGLPPNPNEVLDSDETATNWVTSNSSEANQSSTDQNLDSQKHRTASANHASSDSLIEAQGWVVGADGKVMLVAQNSAETASFDSFSNPARCP